MSSSSGSLAGGPGWDCTTAPTLPGLKSGTLPQTRKVRYTASPGAIAKLGSLGPGFTRSGGAGLLVSTGLTTLAMTW